MSSIKETNNSNVASSAYGIKDAMIYGLCPKKDTLSMKHEVQKTIQTAETLQKQADFSMLRNVQGIHAPLRLHMEQRAVSGIGHLPFLPRHNALLDALTGNDLNIDFDDVLNKPAESEVMGQPHAMMEKLHGLL